MYDRPALSLPELTPAIKRLLILNGIVFLLNAILQGRLIGWLGFSWSGMLDGFGLGVLRVISYQFVHDWSGLGHIIGNMLGLYFFGTMAERALGYLGVYKLYLIGGAAGAVVHLVLALLGGYADAPLIGASGACYAFIVYAAYMSPNSLVILILFPVKLWWLAAGLVAIGVYSTYVEFATGQGGGVSHGAHLGGAAIGALAFKFGWFRDWNPYVFSGGILGNLKKKLADGRARRVAQSEQANRQEVDRILEKVHQSGLQSLTSSERKVLERQSQKSRKK